MPGFGISGKLRQVLFNVWFAKDKETCIRYERTDLVMSDGGTISIDWAKADANGDILSDAPTLGAHMLEANKKKRRVVMVFPGLSGGSDRGYVKALVKTLLSDGFEVAVFHNRGVCDTPYTSLEFADLTRNEDVDSALAFV